MVSLRPVCSSSLSKIRFLKTIRIILRAILRDYCRRSGVRGNSKRFVRPSLVKTRCYDAPVDECTLLHSDFDTRTKITSPVSSSPAGALTVSYVRARYCYSFGLSFSILLPLLLFPSFSLFLSRTLLYFRPYRALSSFISCLSLDHRRLARSLAFASTCFFCSHSLLTVPVSLPLFLAPLASLSVRCVPRHFVVSEPASIDSPRQRTYLLLLVRTTVFFSVDIVFRRYVMHIMQLIFYL